MDSHSIQSLCFITTLRKYGDDCLRLYGVTRDLLMIRTEMKILVTRLLLAGNDTSKGRDFNIPGETAMGNIALD
jgi:hypothetical protein